MYSFKLANVYASGYKVGEHLILKKMHVQLDSFSQRGWRGHFTKVGLLIFGNLDGALLCLTKVVYGDRYIICYTD